MEKTPVLRINGTRYRAKTLSMGAYRQIVMLIDDVQDLEQEDLKDDMQEAIRLTFGLTQEQADAINAADIIPTFREITRWAQGIFTSKVNQLPNVESLETAPGN